MKVKRKCEETFFAKWFSLYIYIWRVDIQKGVTHISEILRGGTKKFPFRHLEIQIVDFQVENKNISDWEKKIVCAIVLALTSGIFFAKKTIFEKLWVTPFWMSTLHISHSNLRHRRDRTCLRVYGSLVLASVYVWEVDCVFIFAVQVLKSAFI